MTFCLAGTNSETHEAEHIMYCDMVKILGTKTDVRTRKRFFKVIDMIDNSLQLWDLSYISSGCLSEGLDLQTRTL